MRFTLRFFTSTLLIIFIFNFIPLKIAKGYSFSPTKNQVGLNVLWTLGGGELDAKYKQRLKESNTKWIREHFSTEVIMGENGWPWITRYDSIMKEYKSMGINVVGMLAYGPDNGVFTPPNPDLWEEFIRLVVTRYKNDVKVWEIWNEPDSPDYLTPNNPDFYVPMIESAYDIIKSIDPKAKVIIGGLAGPNTDFAEGIFKKTKKFDAFNFHVYYCGWYRDYNNNQKLLDDLNNLKRVVDKYKPGQKSWITEMGCSTGETGIDEQFQKKYLQETVPQILNTGWIEKIFIYNIRNYDYNSHYENNFGLLDVNMDPRPSWWWYKNLPTKLYGDTLEIVTGAGPGGGPHIRAFDLDGNPKYDPNNLFAYSTSFRNGVNVALGDINGDNRDEIFTAPRKGGGPQIRIFKKDGSPVGYIWPFHPDSRTGINIATGDVNADGKDEVAVAQSQDGQAWVKVYKNNKTQDVIGEWNAFGEVNCGASVAFGDVDRDGKDEVIVGAGPGGGPHIRIFEMDGRLINQFFAFHENYRGGIDVSSSDVDGDGRDEIGVCQLSEQSWCKVYRNDSQQTVLGEWKAYDDALVGTRISMGDIDRDGKSEILTGTEKNGGPHVRAFEYNGLPMPISFFSYDSNFRGGSDIALGNL